MKIQVSNEDLPSAPFLPALTADDTPSMTRLPDALGSSAAVLKPDVLPTLSFLNMRHHYENGFDQHDVSQRCHRGGLEELIQAFSCRFTLCQLAQSDWTLCHARIASNVCSLLLNANSFVLPNRERAGLLSSNSTMESCAAL